MNKRVKRLWIKALRSEKYKQARGYLKRDDDYCCLGVLCEVYRQRTGTGEWDDNGFKDGAGDESYGHLTQDVIKWAGLQNNTWNWNPKLGRTASASSLNDKGKSFNFIADRIEKYL